MTDRKINAKVLNRTGHECVQLTKQELVNYQQDGCAIIDDKSGKVLGKVIPEDTEDVLVLPAIIGG